MKNNNLEHISSENYCSISWSSNLEEYIAIPRINRLILSPDGLTAVIEVSQLNREKNNYINSLWSIDVSGINVPKRLTYEPPRFLWTLD